MSALMEDDYAPATRSLKPTLLIMLLIFVLIAGIVWKRRAG
jgi:hypothetical protein